MDLRCRRNGRLRPIEGFREDIPDGGVRHYRSRASDGETQIGGDFPSAMDAQKWIDSYLGALSRQSATPVQQPTGEVRH